MSMIKWLQAAVVAMFVAMVAVGLGVLFFATDKMDAFGRLIGIVFPVFLSSVIPALIGSPLTDLMGSIGRAKETKATAVAQAIKPPEWTGK
jgi:hypothetical protein